MTERVDLEELDARYLRDAGSNVRMVNLPIAQLRALIAELAELRQAPTALDAIAQTIADAEARGAQASAAEVARFEGDWSDLAGTDMKAPLTTPAVSEEQLAADLARVACEAIMRDLLGRSSIENAFDDIGDDIRAEIDAACVAKATAAITAALARGTR